MRKSLAEQLPPEPPVDSPFPVSHIRVRLPTGDILARRFKADTPLSILLTYIASQGFPTEEYKVLASWPRKDVCVPFIHFIYRNTGNFQTSHMSGNSCI